MLIVALVLAVVSLAALVTAVVTSNELIAWVCIGLSALGVLLLIADAVRDRNRQADGVLVADDEYDDEYDDADDSDGEMPYDATYDEENLGAENLDEEAVDEEAEEHPDALVYDDPDHDTLSDDEPVYPEAAEEAAVHVVSEESVAAQSYSAFEAEPYEAVEDGGRTEVIYAHEPSYTVSESPTVSYAGDSGADSAIVIYADEADSSPAEDTGERGGER